MKGASPRWVKVQLCETMIAQCTSTCALTDICKTVASQKHLFAQLCRNKVGSNSTHMCHCRCGLGDSRPVMACLYYLGVTTFQATVTREDEKKHSAFAHSRQLCGVFHRDRWRNSKPSPVNLLFNFSLLLTAEERNHTSVTRDLIRSDNPSKNPPQLGFHHTNLKQQA